MAHAEPQTQNSYYYILSDGSIRTQVPEGTPGSFVRKYETSDGKQGQKTELIFKSVEGMIEKIGFDESDYGEQVQLSFAGDDKGEGFILTIPVGNSFGEDLMKKLPNVDFSKEVKIKPYAFEDDQGRNKKGVTVYQDDELTKVQSYFYDPEQKVAINGFPEPEGDRDTYSKDDWKIHFLKARKFLVTYTKEHIVPKFAEGKINYPSDTIDPNNIPF